MISLVFSIRNLKGKGRKGRKLKEGKENEGNARKREDKGAGVVSICRVGVGGRREEDRSFPE